MKQAKVFSFDFSFLFRICFFAGENCRLGLSDHFLLYIDFKKNIARVRNCPDVTILNSLFGFCRFVFYLFVFLSVSFLPFYLFVLLSFCLYPARAQSARARRACALRALGLLLADGVPTVGWGKTFWRVGRVPTRKRA